MALEIMVPTPAIRNLIREDKIHQIYSAMQAGPEVRHADDEPVARRRCVQKRSHRAATRRSNADARCRGAGRQLVAAGAPGRPPATRRPRGGSRVRHGASQESVTWRIRVSADARRGGTVTGEIEAPDRHSRGRRRSARGRSWSRRSTRRPSGKTPSKRGGKVKARRWRSSPASSPP